MQDMPPEGGYKPFNVQRVPLKPIWNFKYLMSTYVGVSAAALYVVYLTQKEQEREQVEMRSSRNVMVPILLAERDRTFLKQLRKNRDDEAELMKNVPGWVVGTWYGEPIFKTRPKDEWRVPSIEEYYAHTDDKHYDDRVYFRWWV